MKILFKPIKFLMCLSKKCPKGEKSDSPPKKPINRHRALGGGWGGGGPNPSLPPNVVLHTTIYITQNKILDCRKNHCEKNCV